MAAIYEESSDMMEIVEELVEKRTDLFSHVEPSMVACAVRIDKIAPVNNKEILKIKGIRGPQSILTEKRYIIFGYSSQWATLSPEKRNAWVANMIMRIDSPTPEENQKLAEKGAEYEWGKLRKPDLNNFKSFIEAVGINWDEDGSTVPDIAEDRKIVI